MFHIQTRDNETSYPVYQLQLKGPQTDEIYEVSSKAEIPCFGEYRHTEIQA